MKRSVVPLIAGVGLLQAVSVFLIGPIVTALVVRWGELLLRWLGW